MQDKITIDVEALSRMRFSNKAEGTDGQKVRVTLKNHPNVRPESRGKTFEGKLHTLGSDPGTDQAMITMIGQPQHMDQPKAPFTAKDVVYGFHLWLIKKVEVVA